ncbi:MAG TPA: helix-turn-helix domain-containing protein [Methanospirillum sp.]|nr:helix-turn-helix domain-containing protein [Methanospirillum sp.]
MQDGQVVLRQDVTVSLDQDMIDLLVEVADTRGLILSAVLRTIISKFCSAYQSGTDWLVSPSGTGSAVADSGLSGDERDDLIHEILGRIARHDEMFSGLQERIALLESSQGITHSMVPGISVSPAVSPASLTTVLPSGQSLIAEVVDSESPVRGVFSEDALVKVRQPVQPIITSVDVSTVGKIEPDKDYSQTEAATLLKLSSSTLRNYAKSNKITSHKIGRYTVFKGRDLIRYLSSIR